MLTIKTRNDKLAAARVDFTSRGMLRGTCLGEALRHHNHNTAASDSQNNEDKTSGPDGNGQGGRDLDLDNEDDKDGSPGSLDGPPVLSEVTLALKKGPVSYHPNFSEC